MQFKSFEEFSLWAMNLRFSVYTWMEGCQWFAYHFEESEYEGPSIWILPPKCLSLVRKFVQTAIHGIESTSKINDINKKANANFKTAIAELRSSLFEVANRTNMVAINRNINQLITQINNSTSQLAAHPQTDQTFNYFTTLKSLNTWQTNVLTCVQNWRSICEPGIYNANILWNRGFYPVFPTTKLICEGFATYFTSGLFDGIATQFPKVSSANQAAHNNYQFKFNSFANSIGKLCSAYFYRVDLDYLDEDVEICTQEFQPTLNALAKCEFTPASNSPTAAPTTTPSFNSVEEWNVWRMNTKYCAYSWASGICVGDWEATYYVEPDNCRGLADTFISTVIKDVANSLPNINKARKLAANNFAQARKTLQANLQRTAANKDPEIIKYLMDSFDECNSAQVTEFIPAPAASPLLIFTNSSQLTMWQSKTMRCAYDWSEQSCVNYFHYHLNPPNGDSFGSSWVMCTDAIIEFFKLQFTYGLNPQNLTQSNLIITANFESIVRTLNHRLTSYRTYLQSFNSKYGIRTIPLEYEAKYFTDPLPSDPYFEYEDPIEVQNLTTVIQNLASCGYAQTTTATPSAKPSRLPTKLPREASKQPSSAAPSFLPSFRPSAAPTNRLVLATVTPSVRDNSTNNSISVPGIINAAVESNNAVAIALASLCAVGLLLLAAYHRRSTNRLRAQMRNEINTGVEIEMQRFRNSLQVAPPVTFSNPDASGIPLATIAQQNAPAPSDSRVGVNISTVSLR